MAKSFSPSPIAGLVAFGIAVLLYSAWTAGAAHGSAANADVKENARRVSEAQARLRHDPSVLSSQFELGRAYYSAGQYPAARNHLAIYLKGCAPGPDSLRAAYIHARSLLASGLRLRATRSFKTLVQRRGITPDASHDLALLLREDKFGPEAVMAEMRALELHSVNEGYLREAGAQWKERRSFAQAIRVFEKLRKTGRAGVADYFELGYLYHRVQRFDSARRYYETALAEDNGHPEAHYNLAVLHQRDKEMDSAVFHLREVMRIRPSYEATYFELAQLFLGQHRNLEAEQVFLQYLEVAQDSSAIHEAKSIIEELQYERLLNKTAG